MSNKGKEECCIESIKAERERIIKEIRKRLEKCLKETNKQKITVSYFTAPWQGEALGYKTALSILKSIELQEVN